MSGGLSSVRNIGELIFAVTSVLPQSSAAAALNGTVNIDRNAHNVPQSCQLKQVVGAIGGAPTSFTVQTKIQHAPDNGSGAPGTFADYAIAGTTQQTAAAVAANTEQALNVDLSGANRWLRTVTTIAFVGGASPTALVQSEIILGGEAELPAV
jgi:hypothetical protein